MDDCGDYIEDAIEFEECDFDDENSVREYIEKCFDCAPLTKKNKQTNKQKSIIEQQTLLHNDQDTMDH